MAVINIIGVVPEDLYRFSVRGAKPTKLADVFFPVLKPWFYDNETVLNGDLEFDFISKEENVENAVSQASFDAPHLTQNQFVFVCRLPEDTVCRKLNNLTPEQELTRWTNFAMTVTEFTLNNRSQSHVIILEENFDSLKNAVKAINAQLAIGLSVSLNTPLSEPQQHLASMVSYAFLKDRTLNRILLELASLSTGNSYINKLKLDLPQFLTSFSMLLKANEALCECKKAISKSEQQRLNIEKQMNSEIEIRESKVGQLKFDNELSMLQVYQLQEELESLYSLMQQETKLKELLQEAEDRSENLNMQKRRAESKNESLSKQLQEANDKNENLNMQKRRAEGRNESLSKQLQEADSMNESLTKKLVSLERQASLFEENVKTVGKNIKTREALVKKVTTENELYLLQIAQLQEELEFYYSKYNEGRDVSSVKSRVFSNDLSIRLIANYLLN